MTPLPLIAVLAIQAADAPEPPAPSSAEMATFSHCVELASEDPLRGIEAANAWMQTGGGLLARQCLGTALNNAGHHDAAQTALVDAATQADARADRLRGTLWGLAGIAALAGGDPTSALSHFDRAIGAASVSGEALGLLHANRARARVAGGDLSGARADLDRATTLAAQDGGVWLLSATLARRMRDLSRAQSDIQQAAALAPRDPAIALEAGNIAWMAGNNAAARQSWQSVIAIAPNGTVAARARAQLAELEADEREASEAQASRVPTPSADQQPVPVQTIPPSP